MSSQDFNTFKIYMKVARELQTNNPIISYYLKAYALNKAVEYLKIERSKGVDIKEKTVQIKDWLQDLEELKAQLSSELTNKEQCKRGYQTFAYGLYEKSDKEYRNGNFTRNLAKDFLYVSVLFDAWELSGGQPEDVKNEKNYANQARFQIIEIIDQGKNQPTANTASPTANPAYKDAHSHIRPPTTPTGDTDTKQKKNDTVDPLAKLNFDLTESIVVPKSTIDKFLDGTRPEVKVAARAVLDSLTTESPKGVQTSPMNANKTPNNPLGLPIGTSVRIDDTVGVNGAQNAIYPNPSNIGFMQNMNIGQGQYPNLCMPNTGFPVVQRQHPQSQFQMVAPCNQPGYPNFGQNYPQSTFQCTFNQQVQPNVLRELQNRAEPSVFGGNKEQQKGNSENMNNVDGNTKMKCQEAKTLCLKAANELDLANIKEAKEKIWKALSILEEMEDRQGQ